MEGDDDVIDDVEGEDGDDESDGHDDVELEVMKSVMIVMVMWKRRMVMMSVILVMGKWNGRR